MLTQFMKKQLDAYLIKNQPGIAMFNNLLNPGGGNEGNNTTDSRSVYSNNNKSAPNQQQ
jgi:hypothetical protein